MGLTAKRVRTKKPAGGKGGRKRVGQKKLSLPQVELAKAPHKPNANFDRMVVWIYGPPGIGKTTFASCFPDAHLFLRDVGGAYIAVHQKTVGHWLEWVAYIDAFLESKHKFAVVDVVEEFFDLCFDFMCDEVLFIEHPNDEKDYGKSWNAIYTEFLRQMKRLAQSGKGVVFISHATESLFKPAFGESHTCFRPALGSKVLERLRAKTDVLGYYHPNDQFGPQLRIRPSESVMAKCWPKKNFCWPDGKPIVEIPMGGSEEEAFANFQAAFRNELERPRTVRKNPGGGLRTRRRKKS